MAVRCPECMREYDVTLFEFRRTLECVCGCVVRLEHREMQSVTYDRDALVISRDADRISFLITSTDYPDIDIEIEKIKFREKIERLFPEKAHLYKLIYEPRFRRLKEQFRMEEGID